MRAVDFNNQFFRTNNNNTYSDSQNNRIWLNLYSNTTFRQMMVNYKSEATDGFDRLFDGNSFTSNEIDIYSTLENQNLVIQGRALPFNENDVVPMGYRVTNSGAYTIAIDELDGLFAENQTIFLRDKLLSIDHNIKGSAYTFTTPAGTFNDRFEIVYTSNALDTSNPNQINTFAIITNQTIRVESSEYIKFVKVYDISGKLINTYSLNNTTKQFTDNFNYPNGVYIAEITLENNLIVKKKLIH
jgi:hypothetical protein